MDEYAFTVYFCFVKIDSVVGSPVSLPESAWRQRRLSNRTRTQISTVSVLTLNKISEMGRFRGITAKGSNGSNALIHCDKKKKTKTPIDWQTHRRPPPNMKHWLWERGRDGEGFPQRSGQLVWRAQVSQRWNLPSAADVPCGAPHYIIRMLHNTLPQGHTHTHTSRRRPARTHTNAHSNMPRANTRGPPRMFLFQMSPLRHFSQAPPLCVWTPCVVSRTGIIMTMRIMSVYFCLCFLQTLQPYSA